MNYGNVIETRIYLHYKSTRRGYVYLSRAECGKLQKRRNYLNFNDLMGRSSLEESQIHSDTCHYSESSAAKEAQELADFETLGRDLANEMLLYNFQNAQEASNWHQ
uniref:AlNc14C64G4606 protein n=1 Tax=Albugo laibachii Nc14 TaxID=890382 RepID=F0WD86_9STRA|nr:AlNc14C64G4606 [Albugo laibachii Nc14]|eukprot:CCA19158.1 AlNc14C64G4606 [Albugo laibachii Nc14]